ncbi:transglutaminase TgpA family protein [Paenibacillus alkalitolerans]|uniref:transglutaminase TgpA family protein n=1 Tax=Paenibacillus alkalitolerans TaxID=2799335 RepID=UPI0018F70CA5|nr:transglutaminase domain-containing protein [Paenibacillus alkalitolerans]
MSPAVREARRWLLADWHEKGIRLFLGIFLYQFVIWFDAYWVNETKPIVAGTLIAVFAAEWFTRRPSWLRRIAGIAAAFAVTAQVVKPEPVKGMEETASGLLLTVLEYVLRLTPFVWFALGTWAIYVVLDHYLTTRWRLISLLVGGIVILSIVDSFSTFVFWDQVAVMIACGLLMLVIHHLRELKTKAPEGYEHLMSYPIPITVMIATIITASLALGMLAPNIRPIIMDPYTAWKTYQGESVPALGKGGGWFDESTTRNSSSGYSRNDTNLGGAFDFDYTPVFNVDTTRRSYWRGETRSLYNGTGWEAAPAERSGSLVPVNGKMTAPEPAFDASLIETVEIEQTFRISTEQPYPVLFAAPFANSVQLGEEEDSSLLNRMFWQPAQGTILWREADNVPYPKTYTVVSHMPVIDEQKLRAAKPVSNSEQWRDYLQLPASVPDRVRRLARMVTQEAETPYDKAKAIKMYLSTTFPYTNVPDVSKGRSADFVDRFLFEIQEGYCDYYSTAMVVMARSIGLPARWVKGYVPGQSDLEFIYEQYLPGEEVDIDGPGTYTVRNSDAHSWVEVYFDGYGWIPFEPTAGFSLPIVQTENETEIALPDDLTEAAGTLQSEPTEGTGFPAGPAAAAAAGLLAVLAVWMGFRLGWFGWLQTRPVRKSMNYNIKFLAEMERLLFRLRRKGLHWSDNETVREIMQRWMSEHVWLQKDMLVLLHAFEKAKYSKTGLSEQEYWNAENRIRKLRESLR